ncbi:membrane protein containing Peptidase M50 domain protein, partial [mine drainage metagenome]
APPGRRGVLQPARTAARRRGGAAPPSARRDAVVGPDGRAAAVADGSRRMRVPPVSVPGHVFVHGRTAPSDPDHDLADRIVPDRGRLRGAHARLQHHPGRELVPGDRPRPLVAEPPRRRRGRGGVPHRLRRPRDGAQDRGPAFGAWAEFRYAPMMLLLSIVMSFAVGFLFAAPGATVVSGMTDPREWGRTSLAGPLANLGFALAFLAAALATIPFGIGVFGPLLLLMFFNAWFGTFNLIPFGPLDGAKVFR